MTAAEAWPQLAASDAMLVDVRTQAEWLFVGLPDVSAHGKQPLLLEWTTLEGTPNPQFISQLQQVAAADAHLFMLCRSGVRSHAAGLAALAAGFSRVTNISDGFEGDLNADGQRKKLGGWCAAGLPWRQR